MGVGGPAPEAVAKVLEDQEKRLAADKAWLDAKRNQQEEAEKTLDRCFEALNQL